MSDLYKYTHLMEVIKEVHSQHADDVCWMDIDKIFVAAGLPVPDRKVGDKLAMYENCWRFIRTMCSGGQWKSYAELEKEIETLKALLKEVHNCSDCGPELEAKIKNALGE